MSSIKEIMKERAMRFKQKEQNIKEKKDKVEMEQIEKETRETLKHDQNIHNYIQYVNKIQESLFNRFLNETQYKSIAFSSCITNEFVDKSRDARPSVLELNRLDEIKTLLFVLWDNIQSVVNINLTVTTELDKKMVKSVEKNIQNVFEIFELGPVQFEIFMDDSNDLEYAKELQKKFDNNFDMNN